MENRANSIPADGFSIRRTVLTLLGATLAFGVLTASYATAELPETAAVSIERTIVAR